MAQAQSILNKTWRLDWLIGIAASLIASLMVCITYSGPIFFSWFFAVHLISSVAVGAFAGHLGGNAMGRVGVILFGFIGGLLVAIILAILLFLFL